MTKKNNINPDKFTRLITIRSEKKHDHAIVLAKRETIDKEKKQYKYRMNYISGVNDTMQIIDGKEKLNICLVQIIEKCIEITAKLLTN